jgi:hypothetical protein
MIHGITAVGITDGTVDGIAPGIHLGIHPGIMVGTIPGIMAAGMAADITTTIIMRPIIIPTDEMPIIHHALRQGMAVIFPVHPGDILPDTVP